MNKTWITKDKKKIKISEMTDSHLLNTIRFLERNAAETLQEETGAAWSCLASLQGEMAQFYCEQDCDRLSETSIEEWLEMHYPIYEHLMLEALKRKLIKTNKR